MNVKYLIPTGFADELLAADLPRASEAGTPLHGLHQWMHAAITKEPNDLETISNLPKRGELTRWIGYVFGNPRILKTKAKAYLPLEPGDPSLFFYVVDAANREGGTVSLGESSLDLATVEPILRPRWMTPQFATAVVMAGGDTEGLLVYFEIDDPTDSCPFSGEGQTWNEWGTYGDSHLPVQRGDKWYRSSRVGKEGTPMKSSEWVPHYLRGEITPISETEFRKKPEPV